MKIVVRIPNWVGDVVMATPALRAIRAHHADAEITVLGLPSGEKILRGSPRHQRCEVYDREGKDRGFFGMGRVAKRLRAHGFDLAVCLPNSFSSAYIFWRAKATRRLGTDYGKRGWMLTDRFRPAMTGHRREPRSMVEHYADVLGTIGIPRGTADLELFETERGKRHAARTLELLGLGEEDRLVAINPGASFGASKLWVPERFAAVADRLREAHGLKPLLIGGPGEEAILHRIAQAMRTPAFSTADGVLDLDALKSAVKRCSLMVTTDTGPRHYAVAFGVPVVVVMGPTDPRYTESNLDRTIVVRKTDVECAPCHLKTCPLTHHGCMEWIEADEVFAAAEELLRRFPPGAGGRP
ncbi:MAG: lipopolysaccharide heptosyltransferase II [Planctomycetes bacterium]|jgi:heptosyltransferase-2|nr:lipopolysaccharide heptosyltransferase II [Planctomycetota bacterium]